MVKNVKWFFVVLVFSSFISLSFVEKEDLAEQLSVGDVAPRLQLGNEVQPLNLHAGNGKYTLLSFWASYDAVSRVKNAALCRKASENAQVRMISVSLDRYASAFRAAVKKDGLHAGDCFVETESERSETFRAYGLENGFKSFLLDENGVIVAEDVSVEELSSYLD